MKRLEGEYVQLSDVKPSFYNCTVMVSSTAESSEGSTAVSASKDFLSERATAVFMLTVSQNYL